MTIQQIKAAAEIAKSRTNDKRWLAAIDKAVAGVESGWWIVTELANCLAIATELTARFGKNKLEMLDDDMLRRVRLAVAM